MARKIKSKYWVQQLREAAGLSVEDLAALTGYATATVKQHDTGNNIATSNFSEQLIRCLGVDPGWMFSMRKHEEETLFQWRSSGAQGTLPRVESIEGNPFLHGKPCFKKAIRPDLAEKITQYIEPEKQPCSLDQRLRYALSAFSNAWKNPISSACREGTGRSDRTSHAASPAGGTLQPSTSN